MMKKAFYIAIIAVFSGILMSPSGANAITGSHLYNIPLSQAGGTRTVDMSAFGLTNKVITDVTLLSYDSWGGQRNLETLTFSGTCSGSMTYMPVALFAYETAEFNGNVEVLDSTGCIMTISSVDGGQMTWKGPIDFYGVDYVPPAPVQTGFSALISSANATGFIGTIFSVTVNSLLWALRTAWPYVLFVAVLYMFYRVARSAFRQ